MRTEVRSSDAVGKHGNSGVPERCLLKWLQLATLPLWAAAPATCDVPTLRLGASRVNTGTQYVVDIKAAAQHIAPWLQQAHVVVAMRSLAGTIQSCGNLSRNGDSWPNKCRWFSLQYLVWMTLGAFGSDVPLTREEKARPFQCGSASRTRGRIYGYRAGPSRVRDLRTHTRRGAKHGKGRDFRLYREPAKT